MKAKTKYARNTTAATAAPAIYEALRLRLNPSWAVRIYDTLTAVIKAAGTAVSREPARYFPFRIRYAVATHREIIASV